MDIDLGIIAALMAEGRSGLKALSDAEIDGTKIRGDRAIKTLEFVREHAREHGKMPSVEFLTTKMGVTLPEVEEPLSVYIQEVRRRHLWSAQVELSNEFAGEVNKRDVEAAHSAIESYQRDMRKAKVIPGSTIDSVWDYGPQIVEAYEAAKRGEMGVRTPWPSINEMTLGFSAGDLIIFVARLGTGKTWGLLMMAEQAYQDGKRVLFISPEMAKVKLAIRYASLHLKAAYNDVRHGTLGEYAEDNFKNQVLALQGVEGLEIMGSGVRYSSATIEDAIALVQPDIVFVDGMYLVRGEGRNRSERVADVADDLKLFAGDYGIPIVCSTQFNRDVKPNDITTVHVGNIGLSDVIGWDADMAFAMFQTDDMRQDKEMLIRPMKVREGAELSDVVMRWDFSRMVFEEIGAEGEDYDDEDYKRYGDEGGDLPPADNKDDGPEIPF